MKQYCYDDGEQVWHDEGTGPWPYTDRVPNLLKWRDKPESVPPMPGSVEELLSAREEIKALRSRLRNAEDKAEMYKKQRGIGYDTIQRLEKELFQLRTEVESTSGKRVTVRRIDGAGCITEVVVE